MNLPFGQQSGSTIGAHFHDKIQVVNSKAKAYCLGRGRPLTVLVARMRLPTIDEIPTFSISHALIQPWQKNNGHASGTIIEASSAGLCMPLKA